MVENDVGGIHSSLLRSGISGHGVDPACRKKYGRYIYGVRVLHTDENFRVRSTKEVRDWWFYLKTAFTERLRAHPDLSDLAGRPGLPSGILASIMVRRAQQTNSSDHDLRTLTLERLSKKNERLNINDPQKLTPIEFHELESTLVKLWKSLFAIGEEHFNLFIPKFSTWQRTCDRVEGFH